MRSRVVTILQGRLFFFFAPPFLVLLIEVGSMRVMKRKLAMGLEVYNGSLNCCKKHNTLYEMHFFLVEFLVRSYPY